MNESPHPSSHVYVVKLTAAGAGFSGRIEHLGSGRRHDFHDRQSLLECIEREASSTVGGDDRATGEVRHVA